MKHVKRGFLILLFIVVTIVGVEFIESNREPVSFTLFQWTWNQYPLFMFAIFFFVMGVLLTLPIMIGGILKLKFKVRKQEKILGKIAKAVVPTPKPVENVESKQAVR